MQKIKQAVLDALATKNKIKIIGNNSKNFLISDSLHNVEIISLSDYFGIIDYQPEELFISVKAGTSIEKINNTLAENNQFLGFTPPDYGNSTIGGTVACALSGPSRPYLGAVRDHILGIKVINAKGKTLIFGGQMIKNVAGFDVTRLFCGSMGKLGIITEVSLKVLPLAKVDKTIKIAIDENHAIDKMKNILAKNFPVISMAFIEGYVYCRLAGFNKTVKNAVTQIKGEETSSDIWNTLNPFKYKVKPGQYLWRLTCSINDPIMPGTLAIDWGGVRRWLVSNSNKDPFSNGKSVLWQGEGAVQFAQKNKVLEKLEKRIKLAFDVNEVFI